MRVGLVCEPACVDTIKALILFTYSGCTCTYHTLRAGKALGAYTPTARSIRQGRVARPYVAERARKSAGSSRIKAAGTHSRVDLWAYGVCVCEGKGFQIRKVSPGRDH